MSELFLELGCEELPARFVKPALEGFAAAVDKLLAGVEHGALRTYGTPRRLVVVVDDVMPVKPVVERLITGPPAAQAWKDGAPTPVALAFAKGKGVDPDTLVLVDTPKGKVVAARRMEGGERTADIVAAGLEAAVASIPFRKSMRWGTEAWRFGRPLHRVCALLGGEVIDTTVFGLLTVGTSVGHAVLEPAPFPVESAQQWLAALRARLVLADVAERREVVRGQLRVAAEREGLVLGEDEVLLDEVTQLVESPSVVVGAFPSFLLELPPRLLVESMKVNQRYFPLFTVDGRLSNHFLVVTNNPLGDPHLIASGNARVLTARFHDARFFYAEDRKKTLAQHGDKLAGTAWFRGLGTMAWRQEQILAAARGLGPLFGADPARVAAAAGVAKADLCTLMVNEFPELQGHVGRLLAEAEGMDPEAALAIEESYLPRGGGDALPTTPTGRTLAVADRAVLLGLAFAEEGLGLIPKGNADPQGLRRAAGGLVSIVLDAGWAGGLDALFAAAGFRLDGAAHPGALRSFDGTALREFVLARFRAQKLAEGHGADVVDAVMAAGGGLVPMDRRIAAISRLQREGGFEPVRTTFRRVSGLAKGHAQAHYSLDLFQHDAEQALHMAVRDLLPEGGDPDGLLGAIVALRPTVDRFFDAVLVMADDVALRDNRLGLLRTILERVSGFADFSRLSSEGAPPAVPPAGGPSARAAS